MGIGRIGVIWIGLVLLTPAAQANEVVVLSPGVDTWIDHSNACTWNPCGDNWVTSDVLQVLTRQSCLRDKRALLRFDLTGLPAEPVARATLRLYALFQNEYQTNTFHISRLVEDWNPSIVDWCGRDAGIPWCTEGGCFTTSGQASVDITDKYGEVPNDGANLPYDEWIEWDVTESVNAHLAGAENFGLLVHQTQVAAPGRNQMVVFASREYADPALRPQLVVETCADGASYPACRPLDTVEQLFAERFSKDAAGFGAPGAPVVYDSTQVTITKAPEDRFYISGEASSLTPWICDDRLYVDGVYVPPVGFDGILNGAFPRCRPMGEIVGPVAAREVTEFIPEGTHCVTFWLADTQREIYGNTNIYLTKEAGPIAVEPMSWGGVKSRHR